MSVHPAAYFRIPAPKYGFYWCVEWWSVGELALPHGRVHCSPFSPPYASFPSIYCFEQALQTTLSGECHRTTNPDPATPPGARTLHENAAVFYPAHRAAAPGHCCAAPAQVRDAGAEGILQANPPGLVKVQGASRGGFPRI
jgi:hypothetical protein